MSKLTDHIKNHEKLPHEVAGIVGLETVLDGKFNLDQTIAQTIINGSPIFAGLISNGNIGINSVSPLAPIQITSLDTGWARLIRLVPQNNVIGYGGYIEFGASATADGYGAQIGGIRTVGNGAGDLIIKTGGNTQKERFRITNSGLIGIGTDAPTNILDIKKSLNNDYVTGMRLQNPNAGNGTAIGMDFTLSSADVILSRIQAIRTNVGSGGVTDLVFSTNKASVGLTEAMRITGAGNVGIGMTPIEKLDVDGNVKATSFIKTSGTSNEFLKADGSSDSNNYALPIVDTYADLADLDSSITKAVVRKDTLADKTYVTLDDETEYEMLYVNPLPPLYGETYADTYVLSTQAGGAGTMNGQVEANEEDGFVLFTLQIKGIPLGGTLAIGVQQNYFNGPFEITFDNQTYTRVSGGWIDNLAYVDNDEVTAITMYTKQPDTVAAFATSYITINNDDAAGWHRCKYMLQPTPFEINYSGIWEKIGGVWTLIVRNDKLVNGNTGVPLPT